MAKLEVKLVRATMTLGVLEPRWEAIVDFGGEEVAIPLPAHCLITDDFSEQRRQSLEAMENLARAFLDFVDRTRKRWPNDQD